VPRGGVRKTEGEAAGPSGDTEQLFAEASVYLRYGKRAQAIENLHAILVQNPRHRAALEKLGDAHADAREPQEAVEAWLRAAELAREESDLQALIVLRDRISALDEQAGAQVAEWLPEGAGDPPELELSEPEESLDISAGAEEGEPEIDLGDIEIEIDDDEPEPAEQPAAKAPARSAPAIPLRAKAAGASQKSAGDSSSASQQIGEDLEEADFYFQQGLHNEAEAIYQRVLALAPNHPLALVRLGEIAAAQGTDPGATGGGFAVGAPEADAEEAATPPDVDIGRDLADWNEDLGEPAASVASGAADPENDLLIEVEDEDSGQEDSGQTPAEDDETDEVAAPVRAEPDTLAEEAEALSLSGEEDEEQEEEEDPDADTAAESAGSAAPAPAPISAGAEADFDLAAELSEAFDEANGRSGSGAGPADDGFASVFGEFKKGVSRMLSAGDHEAHYDLGIAYREMGLLTDAVSEFEAAMGSPARKIDCLHMLGLCTLERGGAADAARYFEQALAAPDATPEQRLAVRFELGRAFEAQGDKARAREAFQAVAAVDPGFCEVGEWLERLDDDAKPEAEAAGSGAGFESFEDLMGEGQDEPKPAAADHESFDDVIAEANQEQAEPEALEAPLDDEPPARAATPARKPGPAAKPGRKKKISFV
jgi:tetratricopeptide (TPR) repeat protein